MKIGIVGAGITGLVIEVSKNRGLKEHLGYLKVGISLEIDTPSQYFLKTIEKNLILANTSQFYLESRCINTSVAWQEE